MLGRTDVKLAYGSRSGSGMGDLFGRNAINKGDSSGHLSVLERCSIAQTDVDELGPNSGGTSRLRHGMRDAPQRSSVDLDGAGSR